jgi:hypothetical protein
MGAESSEYVDNPATALAVKFQVVVVVQVSPDTACYVAQR